MRSQQWLVPTGYGRWSGGDALPREPPLRTLGAREISVMRTKTIKLRVSETEWADLRQRAEGYGISVSAMLRIAGSGGRLPAMRFDPTQAKLLAQLLGQLGRLGGNLNQVSRAINSRQITGTTELLPLITAIDDLRKHIRDILA